MDTLGPAMLSLIHKEDYLEAKTLLLVTLNKDHFGTIKRKVVFSLERECLMTGG